MFAAALGLSLALEAAPHNLAAVILTHHLAKTGVIRRATHDPVTADWTADLMPWLPDSARQSILAPWDSLSTSENVERSARALLRADDARSGFARSLDAWAHAPAPLASPDQVLPRGLAEYEYGLAMRALEREDWRVSLEYFKRAAVMRPGPWPASFVDGYRESLRHANADLADRMSREEATPAFSSIRIAVGRKDYPGWRVPLESRHGWRLEGFALQSPTAIDLGLPSTAQVFWVIERGQATTQTVRVWNMVPDGGFELSPVPPLSDFGWLQPRSAGRTTSAPRRLVGRPPTTSNAAVLAPLNDQSNGILARPIPVNPGAYLLWHASVGTSAGANPTMFVTWRDAQCVRIADEIPIQGNGMAGPENRYAGLLRVPDNAHYLSLTLSNWRAQGEVLWDNVMVLGVQPPS